MALDFRIGTKIIKSLRTDLAPATNVNPYPYIGVVKNNLDPTRSGRVQVFIPELGGNPEDKTNWRTCSYASPFMGYTSTEVTAADTPDTTNAYPNVTHTYGMWMVPPDIGVEVIVMFIAGDPMRGYWLACVNSNLSRHMLPGLAGSKNIDISNANNLVKGSYLTGQQAPVVEFNENIGANKTNPNFYNAPKPIHEFQYNILKTQGLDQDIIRGSISSSSQRETPSQVFGISTPGRPTNDPKDDPNYVRNAEAGLLDESYYRVKSRKGGHTFVMDDGAVLGQDQLVRLRTAGGHQVLMHDTEQTVYISHASGDSWIELTKDGKLNIYNKSGFSLRSEGDVNLHSDKNINFNAGGNISLHAQRISNVAATYSLADTVFDSTTGTWSAVDNQLNSIASIAPTHEPFDRNTAAKTTALSSSTLIDANQLEQRISEFQTNAFIASATVTDLNVLGNLGIGTASTPAKLTIAVGNALISANTISGTGIWQVGADAANNGILLDSFGLPNQLNARRAQGTKASPTALTSGINLLALNGYGYGNTGYSSGSRVQISLRSAEAWTDTAQGTQIVFSTTPAGTTTQTERMFITSGGNVGIGGSPATKLDVIGNTPTGGIVIRSFNSDTSGTSASSLYAQNGTGTNVQLQTFGTDAILNVSSNNPLAFRTNNTERMRILSTTGNVGIGTASPDQKLTVNEGEIGVYRTTGYPTLQLNSVQATGYAPPMLNLNRIGASGTATPNNSLIGQIRFDGLDTASTYSNFATIEAVIGTNASGGAPTYMAFNTASSGAAATERMRIDSTGNVSIGMAASTNARLEVLGSVTNSMSNAGTEDVATLAITNNDVSSLGRIAKTLYEIGGLPCASIAGIYTDFNATNDIGGALAFSTQRNAAGGVVEHMRITSTGNVGIGVASPTVKLDIDGPFKTRGYTVATLPSGVPAGTRAHVTDASAPTFLGAVTGGSTTVCPVFYNGSAWVAG
jgi:hypothetical protein